MSQQWYCKINGSEYGPVSAGTLQKWALEGRLSPSDMVRTVEGQWVAASEIKGIAWPTVTPPPVTSTNSKDHPFPQPPSKATVSIKKSKPNNKIGVLGKRPESWLAIFDWRFEYYLTPWIIRIIWITFLLFVTVILIFNTIAVGWSMLPDADKSSSDQIQTERNSSEMTFPKRPQMQWDSDALSAPKLTSPNWLTVRALKGLFYLIYLVTTILSILITRMILELLIVIFRIAEDIGLLKRRYVEENLT